MWLRAILFSLLLNAPALVDYILHGGRTTAVFSDWDEVYYLPYFQAEAHKLVTQLQSGNWSILWLFSPIPHYSTSILACVLIEILNISPVVFSLGCDLFFAALCYGIFSKAYFLISKERLTAEIGSLVTLALPWILSISQYINLKIPFAPDIVTLSHLQYPCPPILRGIGTQLSYPIFGLSLFFLFRASGSPQFQKNSKDLIAAGILSGLSSYLYFFAWPALVGFSIVFLVLHSKNRLFSITLFLTSSLVAASLAIWGVLRTLLTFSSERADSYQISHRQDFWFFSPEMTVLALVALYLGYKSKDIKLAWYAVSASIFASLGLMNSQAISKAWTVPYHYPLFYLDPIVSGCGIIGIFALFKSANVKTIAAALVACLALIGPVKILTNNLSISADTREIAELVTIFENKIPKGSQILMMPWSGTFSPTPSFSGVLTLPYGLSTLTGTTLFVNPVGRGNDFERELFTGWIFSGRMQLVAGCPAQPPPLPGDMLYGVITDETFKRYAFCQKSYARIPATNLCELITTATPDFVLWSYTLIKEVPEPIREVLQSVAKTGAGEFEIFRFNRELAISKACSE